MCVCVCARAQGCSILDKNSLKRETHSNSVNLLCICILLSCSSLSSSPLITSVNLSLLNPSYNPPPFFFFFYSLPGVPDTFISISHTLIFFLFLFCFSSYCGETFACLWLCFFFNHQKEMNHASMMLIPVCVVRHQILVCEEGVASLRSGFGLFLHVTG